MHLVQLYIEHRTLKLNQTYTYLAPDSCVEGMRVRVSFNAQTCVGFVVKTEPLTQAFLDATPYEIKPVEAVLDESPLLNPELLELGLWMSQTTLAPIVSCFQVMLPKLKNIRSGLKPMRFEKWVTLRQLPDKPTEKQHIILTTLGARTLRYKDLLDQYGTALDTLIKNGYILVENRELTYRGNPTQAQDHRPILSDAQSHALDLIEQSGPIPVCLFGATGSGKTEIYLTLAGKALKANRQALILVPEIGLTPQMVERVASRFGQDVIVYHSQLNDTERYLQYKRVRSGEKTVVVGTRSAIFLPFTDLALIVLDEEHDGSYKQESHPRYHARDIAIRRAETHHAQLILGSATPSFETYARALKGVYRLVNLEARVRGALPQIRLIHPAKGLRSTLDPATVIEIQNRLDRQEQVIILLNRRGYAPVLQCVQCAISLQCTDCDRLLSVHRDENKLKCHSCGLTYPIPDRCPQCGSTMMRMMGTGTQKLEEELKHTFTNARILRMDSDTTSRKDAHEQTLKAFQAHEADILLGTQMIAKGLDIPNVTLSVILEIDTALMRTDYRSVEEAFDLVLQSAGRSGRGDQIGEVIVQTRLEKHYALAFALRHDFHAFFKHEMRYRQAGQNPPYTYLISVTYLAPEAQSAYQAASECAQKLASSDFKVLGPSELGRLQTRFRARIILKGKDLDQMRQHLKETLHQTPLKTTIDIIVDVNPRGLF